MNIIDAFITCFAPILILNYLSIKPQRKFIKRYQEKVNTEDFHGPFEYAKKYRHQSVQQVKDAPRMMRARFELFAGKDYDDKELNKLAKEIRLYALAQIIVMVANFFLFDFHLLGARGTLPTYFQAASDFHLLGARGTLPTYFQAASA